MSYLISKPFGITTRLVHESSAAQLYSKRLFTTSNYSYKNLYSTSYNTPSLGKIPSPSKIGYRNCFRSFTNTPAYAPSKVFQKKNYKQLFISSAAVIGSLVLIDGFLNRDKRAEPLSATERNLLNSTFQHTGVGLTITALLAKGMFKNGLTARMMSMNPLMVVGLGLAGSIGTMFCTLRTSPDNTLQKYGFWLAFTGCQAATLSPLYFYSPVLLSKAALYTIGIIGSLSYVGATAKTNQYLYLGGPLLAGVSVVALSSLAPLVLPVTAARTLMATEAISLYGGLAVFSGFVLYDTQKILHHAKLVEHGQMKADPVNESVGLIMDSINIFIRLVQILGMQSNRK